MSMDQQEWLRRYKQAFMDQALLPDGEHLSSEQADEIVGAVTFEDACSGFEDDPEGAAQEEMSYWEE